MAPGISGMMWQVITEFGTPNKIKQQKNYHLPVMMQI
jgi:hypothetical protein